MTATLFDRIGGDALREVIEDFYRRVFADTMIGFLFRDKNRDRLIQKEWELAAGVLGGGVPYTGRPMSKAHARVPITLGHFDRRLVLLEEALDAHQVDPEVRQRLLDHARSLREELTADPEGVCRPR